MVGGASDGREQPRPDGGLLRHPAAPARPPHGEPEQGLWVADELQATLVRLEALTREIHQLESAVRSQQDEVSRLSDSVQVVEGRTIRHEVGQEQAREVRHEVADLEDRLAQEVSLRRDLAAQVERSQRREAETQQELQRVLQLIAQRLDEYEQRVAAETHRQSAHRVDTHIEEPDPADMTARLERLERRLGAESEGARHQGTEIARLASSVTQLVSSLDAIQARAGSVQEDQRRLAEEVAMLRSVRSREDELTDLAEQQRATRARLEDRVSEVEEALEAIRRDIATASEERALMLRQVAGEAEQRRSLLERIEANRDAFIEHIRRQARTDEEGRRRIIEELERDIRVQRALLQRLSEQTEEGEQEQPL